MSQRRLTAILSADVAGYNALIEGDEAGTLEGLKQAFGVFEPRIAAHGGRVVKFMGDGALAEFASVVSAVKCAVEVQLALAEAGAMRLRIGINLGDVVVEGDDIFGDGVNVAARLQALAAPGGVALSRTVREQIAGKIDIVFDDFGEHQVKANERPVHVFAWGGVSALAGVESADTRIAICVTPFENMSGDPEQDYFADGVSEDIMTDLGRISALKVASRSAALALKGKSLNAGEVSRRLHCAYVLEGSVRKAGANVRITARLVDGRTDSQVWAERYDRSLDDIFAVQAEIAEAIVAALRTRILPAERKAMDSRTTANAEAYKLFLMARHYSVMGSERTDEIVVRLCQRAVELDPAYARAWALMAIVLTKMHLRAATADNGLDAAKRALELDPSLAEAHAAYARILANDKRYDEATLEHATSLELDPESYEAHSLAARTYTVMHRHADAIRHFEKAAELVNTDYVAAAMLIQNYEAIGDWDGQVRSARRALERIERIIAIEPDHGSAMGHGAGILAILGETDRAKDWAERAMLLDPDNRTLKYNLACAMVKLGEFDRALDYLESALQQTQLQGFTWMQEDTDLEPLRSLPRYAEIVRAAEARLASAQG